MATNQRLNATISIGGALSQTFKTAVGGAQGQLKKIGAEIGNATNRQRLLGKTIEEFAKQGKDVSRMRAEYAALGRQVDDLKRRQQLLNRVRAADVGGKFKNMAREVGSLAAKFGALATAAGAGIFALAKSTSDTGDRVAKLADNLGIGIERLQELEYTAERGGMSTEAMGSALAKMNLELSKAAASGKGGAADALREIGLEASALAAMSPDEAINHIADALEGVERMNDRARIATEIFGKEAGKRMPVVLKGGSAALAKLAHDAQQTGYVLREETARDAEVFNDTLLDAKLAIVGVKNTLGAQLMPVVTRVMERFSNYVRENREQINLWAIKFGELAERAVPALIQLVETGVSVASTIGTITSTVAGLVGGFDNLGIIIGTVFAAKAISSIVMFGVSIVKAGAALFTLATGTGLVAGGIKAIGLALMANPIGLIIAAIAGAGLLIYKYWEPIKAFVSDLWDGVQDKIAAVWENIKTVFSWSPLGLIVRGWGAAFEFIKGKLDYVGGAIRKVKSFFGFGGEQSELDQIETAETARQSINAVGPATAPGQGGTTKIDNSYQISIQTQPGQDARQIVDELERRQREREQSALFDGGLTYVY